jgi:gtrA family protein
MKSFNKGFKYELIAYIIFGILTTVVDWVVYYILSGLGVNYIINSIISWTVAVLFAFITNKLFVFDSKRLKNIFRELVLFVLSRLSTLVINLAGMYVLISLLKLNEFISKAILSILVVILNYIFSKLFIFKTK